MKKTAAHRSGSLRPHVMPILVWLVAVAGVAGLFYRRSQRFEILGMAQGQIHQIAATCAGRLKSVPIELFQKVSEGDIIAVIDTVLENEPLEAQLATASAQIQHLMAQLVPTQELMLAEGANQQSDMTEAKRRFEVDVENTRLRVLELKATIETDRMLYMRVNNLNSDNKIFILQNISDPNAQYDLHRLQRTVAEDDVLAKTIQENQHLLAQAEQDLKEAQRRRDEFAGLQLRRPSVDSALDVIRKEIKVQELLVEEFLARRTELVLRSPIDGVVIQLHGRPRDVTLRRPGEAALHRAGEVVLPGASIATIAETNVREIIAYVSQRQLGRVREGMAVQLIKTTEPAQIASSGVIQLGATLERMPEYLWQMPNIPQWGHPVLIEIPPSLRLKPGEVVGIKLM